MTILRPRTVNEPAFGASTEIFAIADTTEFQEYVDGDMDGAVGAIAAYISDTPGSQATIDLTLVGDIHVSFASFKDIAVVGGVIYADDGTNFDLGNNNANVVFGGAMQMNYHCSCMRTAISIGI